MEEGEELPADMDWHGVRVHRKCDGEPETYYWAVWYVKADGTQHGPSIRHFGPDPVVVGRKEVEGDWVDGLRHGVWRQWGQRGTLLGSWVMDHGTGLWRHWHENGELYFEGMVVNGHSEGVWTYYDRNGTVDQIVTKSDGKWIRVENSADIRRFGGRTGTKVEYDSDGRPTFEGQIVDGMRQGVWKYYGKQGYTARKYKDGVEVSSWSVDEV